MSSNSPWKKSVQNIIDKGFTQFKLQDDQFILSLRTKLLELAREKTKAPIERLEEIHRYIKPEELNNFRMAAITLINQDLEFRKSIVDQVMPFLSEFLGNDLVVQRNLNLVLLAPHDLTSQLPLHADTWTGHSPFEIAMLVPLAEVVAEQNMFILPKPELQSFKSRDTSGMTLQILTKEIGSSFEYLNMAPGEVFFFWHHLPHGNAENLSPLTHWSLNLRFKNIFTPYGQKKLGDYFIPLQSSPFTEMVFEEAAWKI